MEVVIRQRDDWDCAPACLAMFGYDYDIVLRAVARVDKKFRGRKGLYNREIVAVAAALGLSLTATRAQDRFASLGVLRVQWPDRSARAKASPGGHAVVLSEGLILDPHDGTATPYLDYAARHGARLCTLLERQL